MALPYLYAHENPHAKRRSNGRRFHGYPSRTARIDLVVVHDTESVLDTVGPDGGAEAVARYQAGVERPSSYHRIIDSDSDVETLPDEAVAFGAAGANSRGLHASLAMRTVDGLRTDPAAVERREAALERLAHVVAAWCRRYDIPVRRISRAQFLAGVAGIVAHADVDPGRRSDPGAWFPWGRFLNRVAELVEGRTPTPPPADVRPPAKGGQGTPIVGPRSRPDHVKIVQRHLRAHGHRIGEVDGIYGDRTRAAVRAHQRAWRITPADGIVGPDTWPSLRTKP